MPDQNNVPLLAAFQNVINGLPDFITDSQGQTGNRKYGYLTLNTLLTKIKPVFQENGLGLRQQVDYESVEDRMVIATVKTFIFNPTNGEEKQMGAFPTVMNADPQKNGSAVTYARRYALFACLGIYPDQDDDGKAVKDYYASHSEPESQEVWQMSHPQTSVGGITKGEADALAALAKERGINLLQLASQAKGHQITKLRELSHEDGELLTKRIMEVSGNGQAQ